MFVVVNGECKLFEPWREALMAFLGVLLVSRRRSDCFSC